MFYHHIGFSLFFIFEDFEDLVTTPLHKAGGSHIYESSFVNSFVASILYEVDYNPSTMTFKILREKKWYTDNSYRDKPTNATKVLQTNVLGDKRSKGQTY